MGSITILADAVADQIAAGEVVERPASVVKELVENALDAGARTITVELEGGGRSSIVVTDDGAGMDRDDAVLALDRHATSKLRQAADLIGVSTYGFRGEALPSIASISRFTLETATSSNEGTQVRVDGGRLQNVSVVARQPGTTVSVRRIFFNAPARRKFLRSAASETRAAVQVVTVLALARLDTAFKLTSDGRSLLEAPRVTAIGDRMGSLFGEDFGGTMLPVDWAQGPISVRGFAQRPADAKASGRRVFLFVNGRPFKDPFLARAAEKGYRATIHPGLRPSLVLSLGVPGEAVDVNVHPAKLEVRFRDRMFVERCVEDAVRQALGGLDASAPLRTAVPGDSWQPSHQGTVSSQEALRAPEPAADLFEVRPRTPDAPPGLRPAFEPLNTPLQVFDTYILREMADGLAIIDQHSAHERVLYERVIAHLNGRDAAAQHLLLPITLDLTADELDALEEHKDLVNRIGYEVEPFGGRSVALHAVPNPHPRFDAKKCFEELVADLSRGRFGGWANRLERFAFTYACRAAIKAGQRLDHNEMRALIDQLMACELPPHDVHGRPTVVQLPRAELERRFGRS